VNDLLTWAPLLSVVISSVALWRTFSGDRKLANDERFKAIELKHGVLVAELDLWKGRVTTVQSDLKHLPDKDVTHRLEMAIANMGTELGKLSERVKPIANMADRMQEAMMEKVMS
jgi:hypothetical protein